MANKLPIFKIYDIVYIVVNGQPAAAQFMGMVIHDRYHCWVQLVEKLEMIVVHKALVFDDFHEAELRAAGEGTEIYFFEVNREDKISKAEITSFSNSYLHDHEAGRIIKALNVEVNSRGRGTKLLPAENVFLSIEELTSTPRLIAMKNNRRVSAEICRTGPSHNKKAFTFMAITIKAKDPGNTDKIVIGLN